MDPNLLPAVDPIGHRDEWLESRRKGIGGSDVAALFGVSPWVSPYSLYLDKLGELPERGDSAVLEAGRDLEPMTRRRYIADTGREIVDCQGQYQHPEHRWMLATTDGTILPCDDHDGAGVFEGKTTNPYAKGEWEDGPPLYYLTQVTHYMVVTGRTWASIAVLVLGEPDPLMWADVELDEEFAGMLVEAERRFWVDHVESRVPPEVDAHPATTRALKAMHPRDSGLVVYLDSSMLEIADELAIAKNSIKEAVAHKDRLENIVRAAMEDATYGVLPDGSGFSWKSSDVKEYRVKARTQRTLRRVSEKSMAKAKRAAEAAMERMIIR